MKRWIATAFFLPSLALAQEAPVSGETPASAPVEQPASAPAPAPEALTPAVPEKEAYNRSPALARKLALYPTLIGFGGAIAFGTAGFLAESPALGSIAVTSLVVGAVGPSVGHFYAGEYSRGIRLGLRRVLIPAALAAAGVGLTAASGGAAAIGAVGSAIEGDGEGASRAALLGLIVGGAMISYSIPSITIMSGRHIRDAEEAPFRKAKKKKLAPPVEAKAH